MVTHPSIKSMNVSDQMLGQFIVLSNLLLEIDTENEFYCGLAAGDARRIRHALPLMERNKNVIESVSGICNVYSRALATEMYTGNHLVEFGSDHSAGKSQQSMTVSVRISKKKHEG
jgi:hypothetical protein